MLGRGSFHPLPFIQKAWFNLAVLLIIVILHWAGPEVTQALAYVMDKIAQGQWWRLITGQLLHTNTHHLILNSVGLILLTFAFNPELNPKRDASFFIICLLCCGIGLALFFPEIHWYKGLSGVLHGYMIYFLFQSMRTNLRLSLLVLAVIMGKVIWEQSPFSDLSATEALIESRVAIEIHLIGAVTGLIVGCSFYCWDRFYKLKNTPESNVLNDMKWAICSPSLATALPSTISNTDSQWQEDQWKVFEPFWKANKQSLTIPAELTNSYQQDRLGIYFEKLVQTWIQDSPSLKLIADHVQVRNSEKQTLGEMDFIVYNNNECSYEHWEIACKFYLGVMDTSKIENWIGPGQKDFLADKWHHLLKKQLTISETSEAQNILHNLNISDIRKRLLLKGRLFYPLSSYLNQHSHPPEISPGHLKGWWTTLDQIQERIQSPYWIILKKHDWLSDKVYFFASEFISSKVLANRVQQLFSERPNQPIAVATFSPQGDHFKETSRGFIVPDDWQHRAEKLIQS